MTIAVILTGISAACLAFVVLMAAVWAFSRLAPDAGAGTHWEPSPVAVLPPRPGPILPSSDVSGELLRALGIAPNVASFMLVMEPDELVTIEVTSHPTADDIGRLTRVIERYHLRAVPAEDVSAGNSPAGGSPDDLA